MFLADTVWCACGLLQQTGANQQAHLQLAPCCLCLTHLLAIRDGESLAFPKVIALLVSLRTRFTEFDARVCLLRPSTAKATCQINGYRALPGRAPRTHPVVLDKVFEVDSCRLPHFHLYCAKGDNLHGLHTVGCPTALHMPGGMPLKLPHAFATYAQHGNAIARLAGGLLQEGFSLLNELLQE